MQVIRPCWTAYNCVLQDRPEVTNASHFGGEERKKKIEGRSPLALLSTGHIAIGCNCMPGTRNSTGAVGLTVLARPSKVSERP